MLTPSTSGECGNEPIPPPPALLATITTRITDDTTGTVTGGSFSVFAAGQAGSISLLGLFDDVPDDSSTFTLEIKVSSGTVRVRALTQPDSEDAALAVNNVAVGSFFQNVDDNLAVDFSTNSNVFVTLLSVVMTPAAATDIQLFASINFTWVP